MHATLEELDALLGRARRVSVDGDRVPLFIRASMTFLDGQNKAAPMVFNLPVGEDFFATRLNLYLASRLVSIAAPDTQSELTFRATDWTSVDEFSFIPTATTSGMYQNKYASCFFEVRSSSGQKFQNAPMSGLHAFSDREPQPLGTAIEYDNQVFHFYQSPYAAYVGGMDFDVEERIPAGTSWTLTVTPTFSRDVSAASVYRREFMAIGIMTGHKKIKPNAQY